MPRSALKSLLAAPILTGGVLAGGAPAAAAPIEVIAYEIPGLHQADSGGFYDRVIERIAFRERPTLRVTPPARADALFERCTDCCITPMNKSEEFYDFDEGYIATDPISVAAVLIWTAPGAEPVTELAALKGLRVGGRLGMPYGFTVDNSGIDIQRVRSIEANIRKTQAGRLDAFFAYIPDALTAFENEGVAPFPHDADNPVAVHPDSLLCKDTGATRAFVEAFNAGLAKLKESGELDRLAAE